MPRKMESDDAFLNMASLGHTYHLANRLGVVVSGGLQLLQDSDRSKKASSRVQILFFYVKKK